MTLMLGGSQKNNKNIFVFSTKFFKIFLSFLSLCLEEEVRFEVYILLANSINCLTGDNTSYGS
jgi:hypothetical protein